MLKTWRRLSLKSKLLLAGLILVLALFIRFQIYFHGDYRDMFLENKGTLVSVADSFLQADSIFENYDVRVTDSNGLKIAGYLRTPKDTTRHYPGLLVLNGFDTGKDVISLFRSTEEAVLLSFDYPYEGPRRFKGTDIAPFLPRIRHAIFRAVSVVLTMIDYLEQRPEVDPEKIFVVGASFGAPFAVNAAAVEPRIKAVILLYGGGDISLMVESSTHREVKSVLGKKILGWLVASLLAPMEPLKYVEYISPRPLLMINGKHDEDIFGDSAELLFKKARQPKKIIWLDTKHAKPRMSDLTHQLEQMMKQWLSEEGLL